MNHSLFEMAKAFLKAQHKKKIWYRVLYSMAVLVIFVTTYMLILPAITMERPAVCGMEEHVHTEDCYAQAGSEPVRTLNCGVISENPVIHTHDANCYDENGNLICQLSEVRDHIHTDACYTSGLRLTCGLDEEGTEGFGDGSADLFSDGADIFSDGEAHIHTEECYQEEAVLNCGEQEVIPHTHGTDCYDEAGKLVCTLPEINEHQHTEECFTETEIVCEPTLTCGKEEHVHTEECYPVEEPTPTPEPTIVPDEEITETPTSIPEPTELPEVGEEPEEEGNIDETVPIPEVSEVPEEDGNIDEVTPTPEAAETPAEDNEDEISLICGREEHIHIETCYGENDELICELEEHEHTADCISKEDEKNYGLETLAISEDEPVQTNEENDVAGDLTAFLTNLLLLDSNGNAVTTLYDEESYKITLAFAENTSLQFKKIMTYQLPAGLTLPLETKGTLNKNGEIVADYVVTEEGLLTVTFRTTDTYPNGWHNSVADGSFTIGIDVRVDKTSIGQDGNDSIKFSDSFTFKVDTPVTELNAVKYGAFQSNPAGDDDKITTGTISYTVTATAKNGDVSSLVITDALEKAEECICEINGSSFSVMDSDGATVPSINYTVSVSEDKQSFTLTFDKDYKLEKGKSLTIKYNADVSGLDPESEVGFSQKNAVEVQGETVDGTPVEKETDASTWISVNNAVQKTVEKSGQAMVTPDNADVDAEEGTIVWNVEVTDGNGLAGSKVKDILGKGLTWDGGPIIVRAFDKNGNEYDVSVDSSSVTSTENVDGTTTLEFVLPKTNAEGEMISYVFAKLFYTTNYKLDEVPANGSKVYENTFTVTEDAKGEAGPHDNGTVSIPGRITDPTETIKEMKAVTDEEGNTILNCNITVKVPGLEEGYSPFYIVDSMTIVPNGSFDGWRADLKMSGDCVSGLTVSVSKDNLEEDADCPYKYEICEDGKLYIYFNGENIEESRWTLNEDATIQISYAVDLNALEQANVNVNGSGNSLSDYICDHGTLTNTAVNHYAEKFTSGKADYSESYELAKEGEINSDGSITYTVTFDGLKGDTDATLLAIAAANEAYFVDELPEGWKYKEGTLAVEPLYAGGNTGGVWKYWGESPTIGEEEKIIKASLEGFHEHETDYKNLKCLIKENGQSMLNAYKFTYTLEPTDEWLNELTGYDTKAVVNKVRLQWDSAQTPEAGCTVDYGKNPLNKTAKQDDEHDNLFHFTIEINKLKEQLLTGEGTLNLTDTMSTKLNLDISTLEIKNGDTNDKISGYTPNYVTGADNNLLTISDLPDKTYLIVTYDTYVNEKGENISFSNTVELTGKSSWSDTVEEENVHVSSSGGADGSTGKFYIHKIDSQTGESLSGAVFQLYLVGNSQIAEELVTTEKVSLDGGKSGELDFEYWYNLGDDRIWEMDGSSGWFQIGNKTNTNKETQFAVEMFTKNGFRFVLVETQAPEGYEQLADPLVIAYGDGTYTDSEGTDSSYNIEEGIYTVDYAGTVTVENAPLTNVSVQKEWKDSDGQTVSAPENTSIEVALMQVAHYKYEIPDDSVETYILTKKIVIWDEGYNASYDITTEKVPKDVEVTVKVDGADIFFEGQNRAREFTFRMDKDYTVQIGNILEEGNWTGSDKYSITYPPATIETEGLTNPVIYSDESGSEFKESLNEDNKWAIVWSNLTLPQIGEVTVGGISYPCTYTYNVVERTPGNWSVAYTLNGQTNTICPDIASTDSTVIITNTIENQEATSITVEKKWISTTGEELGATELPDSIEVQLYKTSAVDATGQAYGFPVTLGASKAGMDGYGTNGWSYTWDDLPEGLYYVVETLNDGEPYTVTYSNSSQSEGVSAGHESEAAVASGTITITNTKQRTMEVTVKKKWLAVDGTEKRGHPDTIQVGLYKKGQSEGENDTLQSSIIELGSAYSSVTGYSEEGWGYTWSNLPLGTYYVKEEVVPEGYNATYLLEATGANVSSSLQDASIVTVGEESSNSTVILYNQETPVEISVQKEWGDGADKHANDVVTMQLYSSTIAPQLQPSVTPEPSITAEPTPTVTVEPTATPVPTATPEPSIVPTVSPEPTTTPGGSKIVILRYKQYNEWSLLAEEDFKNATSGTVRIGFDYDIFSSHGVTEDMLRNATWESIGANVSVSYSKYEVDDSRRYVYYSISNVTNGCTLIFDFEKGVYPKEDEEWNLLIPDISGIVSSASMVRLAAVSSAQADTSTETEASENDVSTGILLPDNSMAVGSEISLGTNHGTEEGYESGGWKYTWSNLPRTNAEGQKLYYYIKETSTGNYTTSYSYEYIDSEDPSKGINLVTVTNTPTTPTTVDITVKKEWVGYDQNSYADYQVEVQLLQNGRDYGNPITLSASSDTNTSWSYTWQNLPSGYKYSVGEIQVTNSKSNLSVTEYKASYSNNAGITAGEITITNTRETTYELPETGGPGTKLYTLGGLLLSVLAALLMYKQQKQRREVN